mgnify:CR=1 FL=1
MQSGVLHNVGWNRLGGWRLWIEDTGGNWFYYAHLSAYAPIAVNGAHVSAGDVVGFVGHTGDAISTPSHLHFEIRPGGPNGIGVLADRWFDNIKAEAPDLRVDTSDKNAILGPSIGTVDGVGRTYAGSWTTPQGATTPVGVSLITASNGRTTVAVVLLVWNPDQRIEHTWVQYAVRGTAELALKTFRWGPLS